MILKTKYNNDNPANSKYNLPLIHIRNAIKNYINSKPKLKKYYDFSNKNQEHHLDTILDECIERVKFGKTYRSSKLLPKSTFNDAYKELHKKKYINKHIH